MGRSTVKVSPLLLSQILFDYSARVLSVSTNELNEFVMEIEGDSVPDCAMCECTIYEARRQVTFKKLR